MKEMYTIKRNSKLFEQSKFKKSKLWPFLNT